MNKNILIIIVVLVLILLGAIWFRSNDGMDSDTQTATNEETPQPTERVMQSDAKTTLSAFPDGFPVESGISQSSGFKYIPANSLEQQSTVEYVSQKSLAENQTAFKAYLEASGFKTVNEAEDAQSAFYYATKDNNDLSVRIILKDGTVTVTASYLKR